MRDWRDTVVKPGATIRDAIAQIDASAAQIALVVNDEGRLLGTVTDGDVRRALLGGRTLDVPVEKIMRPNPTSVGADQPREAVLTLMQARTLRQIPVLNHQGVVVGLEVLDELLKPPDRENWVLLMAGGLGSRLRPLTQDCPKPMLRVGDRPILEHIIESFVAHGFRRFFISVFYLSDMIEAHFGDGSQWGARIEYLRETDRLGTAGGLSLLPQKPTDPLLVMNGDLLTKVNFSQFLDFHTSHNAVATMGVRTYEHQIPYGVVSVDGQRLLSIEEKPKQRCFVSAGIYLLDPDVVAAVEPGRYLDMPSLFQNLVTEGRNAVVFPVREYWLDIGRLEDFNQASGDYEIHFK